MGPMQLRFTKDEITQILVDLANPGDPAEGYTFDGIDEVVTIDCRPRAARDLLRGLLIDDQPAEPAEPAEDTWVGRDVTDCLDDVPPGTLIRDESTSPYTLRLPNGKGWTIYKSGPVDPDGAWAWSSSMVAATGRVVVVAEGLSVDDCLAICMGPGEWLARRVPDAD